MPLALEADVLEALQAQLPHVAERTIDEVTTEVAEYAGALSGVMGANIRGAVQLALGGFLRLAATSRDGDQGRPVTAALEGAYALGRGEARSGRTADALLSAYRVGARVAWRELSATAVTHGLDAGSLAQFAELVFAYIDQLSASSVAGHTDELATSGRVREQYLEQLATALLQGAAPDVLTARAERAEWTPPTALAAVLLPSAHARSTVAALPPATLAVGADVAGLSTSEPMTVLLVPDVRRASLLRALRGHSAVVGPTRPWVAVAASYRRAVRALPLAGAEPLDTEQHLTALVLGADPEALRDLRAQALAPLQDLRPGTADRLAETLRAWLLHHGRREDVAAALVVHPQTVRYRMTQLRELYGDRLTDPEQVLLLTVALALPPG